MFDCHQADEEASSLPPPVAAAPSQLPLPLRLLPRDVEPVPERAEVLEELERRLRPACPAVADDARLLRRFALTRDYDEDATEQILRQYVEFYERTGLQTLGAAGVSGELAKRHVFRLPARGSALCAGCSVCVGPGLCAGFSRVCRSGAVCRFPCAGFCVQVSLLCAGFGVACRGGRSSAGLSGGCGGRVSSVPCLGFGPVRRFGAVCRFWCSG